MRIKISCAYDEDAGVWYVEESDLPGLHIEAARLEDMVQEIRALVPELVRLNRDLIKDGGDANVPIELLYQHRERLPVAC